MQVELLSLTSSRGMGAIKRRKDRSLTLLFDIVLGVVITVVWARKTALSTSNAVPVLQLPVYTQAMSTSSYPRRINYAQVHTSSLPVAA